MNQTNYKTSSRLLLAPACVAMLLLALPTLARSQERGEKTDKGDEGFVSLFNGKDLSGWQTSGRWGYEAGGVLALKPPYGRKRLIPDTQSFLWSKHTYADFVLDLEFRVDKGTSSGVFMRSTSTRSYVQTQIRDSYGQQALGDNTAGAVVGVAAPKKNMAKPAGEWNHMIITCNGDKMQVELNGEQIVNTDLSKSQEAKNVRSGRIGFENANSPIAFRNVKIKELKR